VFLFGTLAGKDAAGMAEATATIAESVVVTAWPSARAADVREMAEAFRPFEAPVSLFASLEDAYDSAVMLAGERGAVVAFGSLAFVAVVREWVLGIESDAMRLAVTPEG
jgi:folylpolyglutamate synthase/dihydropteroate synthase